MNSLTLSSALELVRGERRAQEYDKLRTYISLEYPNTIRALHLVDMQLNRIHTPKGYNLVRRDNKKLGYVYYVRYRHGGKMLPSKWNTGTNVREEAERFAKENRRRIVEGYLASRETFAYTFFEHFFESGSEYFLAEQKRSAEICEKSRKKYHFVMNKRFVPFLKEKKIAQYEQITAPVLSDFQDWLLACGLRPQSVNDHFNAVRKIFVYLVRKEMTADNPCLKIKPLAVRQRDRNARGCYEIDRLRGIFAQEWGTPEYRLLAQLIYTTGMRNSEILRIRTEDIKTIDGCHFIDVKTSKTPNGLRLVPLHSKTREMLLRHAEGRAAGERVFKSTGAGRVAFCEANRELAEALGAAKDIKRENITFYSGRHFWKTLMSREGLGADVEELFMGHKVCGNVALLYDHRDKRGQEHITAKAKQVYRILDKALFAE